MATLQFPRSEVVGTLDWAGAESSGLILATGSVDVPEAVAVTLSVTRVEDLEHLEEGSWAYSSGDELVDLSFVESLDPSAIAALDFGGQIVPASVRALPHLAPGLKRLTIRWADLADDALSFIAQLVNLTDLQTFGNRFTDAGVQQLVSLQDLRNLWLEEESLSAAAFRFTTQLPQLRRLGLQDVSITEDEIGALKAMLPGVSVG